MCSRVNRETDKREAAPTSCYINTSDGENKRICYQWSYQLPARQGKKKKKKPPQGWSPVLMRSLNELAEEEVEEEGIQGAEEEGSQAGIPEMWCTVAGSLTETASCCTAGLTRIRAGGGRRESPAAEGCTKYLVLCALCQQGLPPWRRRGEEREEREEDGQGERLCDERCIQVDAPLLLHENRPMGFAPHRTPLMLYSISRDVSTSNSRVKPTHCVYWSICTNTCAPSAT